MSVRGSSPRSSVVHEGRLFSWRGLVLRVTGNILVLKMAGALFGCQGWGGPRLPALFWICLHSFVC